MKSEHEHDMHNTTLFTFNEERASLGIGDEDMNMKPESLDGPT